MVDFQSPKWADHYNHESRFPSFGSLHEAAASSVFCRLLCRASARILVLSDVRSKPASSSWPDAVCTSGRRIVLNAIRRIGCNQYVPRSPVRPDFVNRWRRRYRRSLLMRFLPFSIASFCCSHAAAKCVPSFQIRPSTAASLRATATRARLGPRRLTSLRPQLLSTEGLLTVVKSTFAAS
jgi:hypothetical protein